MNKGKKKIHKIIHYIVCTKSDLQGTWSAKKNFCKLIGKNLSVNIMKTDTGHGKNDTKSYLLINRGKF